MKNFLKTTRAAFAVEFAIILPVLLLMLFGIIQFGVTLFFDSSLNAGIRAVSREGVATGFSSNEEINRIMSDNLGGLYDPKNAEFMMLSFDSFNQVDFTNKKRDFNNSAKSIFSGNYGDMSTLLTTDTQSGKIILYAVRYKWGSTFGITNPFLPDELYAFSIIRDENLTQ